MNYLGHLFLSDYDAEVMAGNFLTDFLTLEETRELPPALYRGVELHRKIDNYTDNHHIVRELTVFLRDSQHKYAPVALDIIFDYLLCKNWETYADIEYEAFCQYTYITLNRFLKYIPEDEQKHIHRMIDSRWLSVYQSISGLHKIMDGMDRRSRFPSHFHKAISHLNDNYVVFNEKFNQFFPEIIEYLKEYISPEQ